MHHDIVDYLRGSEHEETVEIKVSLAAAASPASTLVSYGYTPIGDADKRCEVSHTPGNAGTGFIGKLFNIIVCKLFNRQCVIALSVFLFQLSKMFHYPIGAVCYELFNIAAGSLIRSADDDAHIGTDFYGKGFSGASYNFNFYIGFAYGGIHGCSPLECFYIAVLLLLNLILIVYYRLSGAKGQKTFVPAQLDF